MKITIYSVLLGIFLLVGCSQPKAEAQTQSGGSGTIEAINHTKWAINHFSVNGQSGIDIIGPFQGGGGMLLWCSCRLETGNDGTN